MGERWEKLEVEEEEDFAGLRRTVEFLLETESPSGPSLGERSLRGLLLVLHLSSSYLQY